MIKRCLFPAAGYGTRFLPATKAMPKEMLPVLTKPLIQYGVEEAYEAGCTIMATITGRGKRAITDHFDRSYELEHQIEGSSKEELLSGIRSLIKNCTFSYTRQNEMKGLGDAIYKGQVLVGDTSPFAVILADDLCVNQDGDGVLKQMIKLYEKYKCSIVAIMEVPKDQVYKYGVISGKEIESDIFMLDDMVEKPDNDKAPSNLAIIGRYILTPDIFEIIENTKPGKNGELQITDALLTQAKKGMVLGYKFKGKRFDCGSLDGFVEATNYFYNMQTAQEEKQDSKKKK
jgi:UTP--glucose-1-phosphate uridylyltransferase